MKTNRVRAKNTGAASKIKALKNTGARLATSAAETSAHAPTWKPDRAWHAQQWANASLFKRLKETQAPVKIASHAERDEHIWFARDSEGKEWFFIEEPLFQYPDKRCLKVISRKSAFGIICVWSVPACLRDYMAQVLKKGGAW